MFYALHKPTKIGIVESLLVSNIDLTGSIHIQANDSTQHVLHTEVYRNEHRTTKTSAKATGKENNAKIQLEKQAFLKQLKQWDV